MQPENFNCGAFGGLSENCPTTAERQSLTPPSSGSASGKRYPTVYTVLEKVQHRAADRTPVACSTFPFIPTNLQKLLEFLRAQPLTRDQLGTTITIGSVNIQINVVHDQPVDIGAVS